MAQRRFEDRSVHLVLASTQGAAIDASGSFRAGASSETGQTRSAAVTFLDYTKGPHAPPQPALARQEYAGHDQTALLLDLGAEGATLVLGAEMQTLPRGNGGPELLERAAAGAAAWDRERVRAHRRLQLPDKLIDYQESLAAAETHADVCRALITHAVPIVGAYTAVLFVRDAEGAPLRPWDDPMLGRDHREFRLPFHPRFTRPGLIRVEDARPNTGSPFSALASVFSESSAVALAHVPFDGGAVFLTERRRDRVFDPEDWHLFGVVARQAQAALRRVRLFDDVRDLSLTDPLTGLANRRRMNTVLEHLWAIARRGRPLALAMIDLDEFKQVNDRLGHVAGDRVLVAVADALRGETRGTDLIVRYGGDEFLLILPDSDLQGARTLLDRVRERLADQVQMSAGVATYSPTIGSMEELIEEADRDLYVVKRRGRGRGADRPAESAVLPLRAGRLGANQ